MTTPNGRPMRDSAQYPEPEFSDYTGGLMPHRAAIQTMRDWLQDQATDPMWYEAKAALDRIDRVALALESAQPWWWHKAHDLHDDAHHAAHRSLDLCVPLLQYTPELREALA